MCTHHACQTEAAVESLAVLVRAPLAKTSPARVLQLAQHEALRVIDAQGRPLVDIVSTEDGPVLQLLGEGTDLDVAGHLRVHADAIEMIARDGELKMLAKDDVIVRGEKVRLN